MTAPARFLILGIAQDAGYPQAGCRGACCARAWADPAARRHAASAAVVEPGGGRRWLIDATPDFRAQLHALDRLAPVAGSPGLAGIFLSHGHMGHYTGLMQLGREAMGARGVPVYALPRLAAMLQSQAPWADLVAQGAILLRPLRAGEPVPLAPETALTAFPVPHRAERTETAGFRIRGPRSNVCYIPDIDSWDAWDDWGHRIEDLITGADRVYADGTFFDAGELPGRRIERIPHPLIKQTLGRLAGLDAADRAKLRFIHLNHSNPALDPESAAAREIRRAGFGLAEEGEGVDV